MKNYTDLEQSKKLAKILPLESADMWYHGHGSPWEFEREYDNDACPFHSMRPNWDKPSWSLAALLGILPDVHLKKYIYEGITKYYATLIGIRQFNSEHYDNPVDACYEMILKLHELKML